VRKKVIFMKANLAFFYVNDIFKSWNLLYLPEDFIVKCSFSLSVNIYFSFQLLDTLSKSYIVYAFGYNQYKNRQIFICYGVSVSEFVWIANH